MVILRRGLTLAVVVLLGVLEVWAWPAASGQPRDNVETTAESHGSEKVPRSSGIESTEFDDSSVPIGDFGEDENVVGPNDVSSLDIDFAAAEEAISATGADFVMLWLSGDNEDSVVVVAVHGGVSDADLFAAVEKVTPYYDRFRFVQSRHSTKELEDFVYKAQEVWKRNGVTWKGAGGRWVLDTMLQPDRYGALDSQPTVWIMVPAEREAELTAELLKVIPADAMVIDGDAKPWNLLPK